MYPNTIRNYGVGEGIGYTKAECEKMWGELNLDDHRVSDRLGGISSGLLVNFPILGKQLSCYGMKTRNTPKNSAAAAEFFYENSG